MLRKMTQAAVLFASLSFGQPSDAPYTGSKVVGDVKQMLPTLPEWQIIHQSVNIYVQVSSLVRTFNSAVANFEAAQINLERAKSASDNLWGDLKALEGTDIYSLDGWERALRHTRENIVASDIQGFVYAVSYTGNNLLDGTFGTIVNGSNAISYDARIAGVDRAFKLYYHNIKWNTFLESQKANPALSAVDPNLSSLRDQNSKQIMALASQRCPSNYSQQQCQDLATKNADLIASLKASANSLDDQITDAMGYMSIRSISESPAMLRQQLMEGSIKKIHLDMPDFVERYVQLSKSGAALGNRLRRYQDERVTSERKSDTAPHVPGYRPAPKYSALCADPAGPNFRTDPKTGTRVCIYGDPTSNDYRNSVEIPTERSDTGDWRSLAIVPHEKPRPLTLIDYQKIKSEIRYLSLRQEELLLDMELNNALADLSLKANRIQQSGAFLESKIQIARAIFGHAIEVGLANGVSSTTLRNDFLANYNRYNSWDPNDDPNKF